MTDEKKDVTEWRVRIRLFFRSIVQDILKTLKVSENLFMLLGGAIIGVAGGYGSVFFKWLIETVQNISWGGWGNPSDFLAGVSWYWILLIPAIGGLLTGLIVYFFAPEAKGHGVPEVMEANILKGGIIRLRVPIAKSLASAINIGTGGSVGREGPIVQIGSAVGSIIGQITQIDSNKTKLFVACGAAAGIAGTFNAPIAGALFALEIILGDFGIAYISPIVVSSVLSTVIAHQYIGQFQSFHVSSYQLVSAWELIPYTILGLLTGLVALAFVNTLYKSEDLFDKLPIPGYIKPMIAGLILGGIALQYPQIMGVGYEVIDLMLVGKIMWTVAGVLILGKLIATSLVLGSGGSGGIFAPSLFMGAMTGGFMGHFVHMWFPNITASSGAYALVGMAGVVGAAAHAPLTAILIIFELTNDYAIILPVMITTIVAVVLASRIQKESIYTLKLVRKGIDLHRGRDVNVLHSLQVSAAMRRSVETVNEDTTLNELMTLMARSNHSVFFIVNDDEELTGYVTLNDLRKLMPDSRSLAHLIIAGDIAHDCDFALTANDTLNRSMELFVAEGIEELPIVKDKDAFKPVATLWRQDVIEAYNREVFRRDMSSGLAKKITSENLSLQPVEILTGFSIVEVEVPKQFVGQTVGESQIRDQHGVQIFLVRHKSSDADGVKEVMPSAGYQFSKNDSLIIFGETKYVKEFRHL